MINNVTQARDEMFAMFREAWETNSGAVVGGDAPAVLYEGLGPNQPPAQEFAYARVKILHRDGKQASLAGADNTRRWKSAGLILVQCFGPHASSGKGLTIAEGLATIALNAFRGKASPGGIWFRNPRISEVGPTDGWFQVNAVVEFTYDEVK